MAVSQNQVCARHDIMGRGIVISLTSTRAVLSTINGNILVTPKDTYNDQSIDITDRLRLEDEVIYKANRISDLSAYPDVYSPIRYVSNYVRKLSNCIVGEGKISIVLPTFGFVDGIVGNNMCRIFFPISGLYEPGLEIFRHRTGDRIDFEKLVRVDDPVKFVAVQDASTVDRSPYGVEVTLNFNHDASNPIKIGIVTEVRRSECNVFAKNFSKFSFALSAADHFHIRDDLDVDLREIVSPGTRVRFHATPDCDISQIKDVEIIDVEEKTKLSQVQRRRGSAEMVGTNLPNMGAGARPSSAPLSKSDPDTMTTKSDSPSIASATDDEVVRLIEQELAAYLGKELGSDQQSSSEESTTITKEPLINGPDVADSENYTPSEIEAMNSIVWPDEERIRSESHSSPISSQLHTASESSGRRGGSASAFSHPTTNTADAACQTNCIDEVDILKQLLKDEDIFKMACERYTWNMHQIWQGMHW